MRCFVLCAALWLTVGCAPSAQHVQIIHTTDIHGHFDPGLRHLEGLVTSSRTKGDVLLLDSGDMWSGTMMSDDTEGALGIQAFNILDYDAAALGNHEFDYGPVGPPRSGGDAPFEALQRRLKEATFPILAANLKDRLTGQYPAWTNLTPSTLIERGGIAFGVIGAITEETPQITFPYVGKRLIFTAAARAVTQEAAALRARGADVVILLSHMGGECPASDHLDDLSSCEAGSELVRLVEALPDGAIDLALGGHTHRPMARRVKGVFVGHTGAKGTHAVIIDVYKQGEMSVTKNHRQVTLNDYPAKQGGSLNRLLDQAAERQRSRLDEQLGMTLDRPLTRDRLASSTLGTFLCTSLLASHPDREICILNNGGIRRDFPAGPVTYGDLYDTLPFGNVPAYLDISGDVVRDIIRLGTSGAHGVVQVKGLQATYDLSKDTCPSVDRNGDGVVDIKDRDRLVSLTLEDGSPFDPTRTYRVITSSFLASGGDGWADVLRGSVQVLNGRQPLRDDVATQIRAMKGTFNTAASPLVGRQLITTQGEASNEPCPNATP